MTAAQLVRGFVVVELVDFFAQIVARDGAVVFDGRNLRAPRGVERIEGMRDLRDALRTVARADVGGGRGPFRAEHVRVGPRHGVAGAVDGAAVRHLQGLAPAEKIRVLQVEIGAVRAAGAAEGEARTQGPHILGDDLDIDLAVGVVHRHDSRVVDVAQQAQGTFGFREFARAISVPAREQQLRLDARAFGAYVQAVRQPKQPVGLARIGLVENIANVEVDLADDGPGRFQLAIARHIRGTRLLDAGVFFIGELRRQPRFGYCRGEDREPKQPATVG